MEQAAIPVTNNYKQLYTSQSCRTQKVGYKVAVHRKIIPKDTVILSLFLHFI